MRTLFALFFLLSISVSPAMAQTDKGQDKVVEEYRASLEQLLEVSGAKTTMSAQLPHLMKMLRDVCPDVPEEVMNKIENKFRDLFLNNIMSLYTPIYMRYMTIDEVKEFTAFYNTPLGRKVAMVMPTLSVELAQAGRSAGEDIAKEVLEELVKEGYKPTNM
ncbi:MAG: DUF2059 domain-containing protein [Prevotella sp.]|nr:DUF2059 domain-containing protein [Prevotella sp.]